MEQEKKASTYTIQSYLPLIIIFCTIGLLTIAKQITYGICVSSAMADFMGFFFLIFGFFKVINIHGFADAYSTYDVIAKRSTAYAYIYPFLELALGAAYLSRYQLTITNYITLILMIVGSIGVVQALLAREQLVCACLGVVFKIPMTYVTLAEDLLMGVMAALMLLI